MNPVQKANWYIECFLMTDLDLDTIARAACVTPYYLTRAFGHATGSSVIKYVRQRRLTEAARRLAAGEKAIIQLAQELCYQSHEAFSRAFREQFGFTPEAVRKQGHTDNLVLIEACNMSEANVKLDTPEIINHPGMLLAGITKSYTFESSAAIPAQWQRLNQLTEQLKSRTGDAAYGVICNDDSEGNFEYMTAMQVTDFADLKEPFSRLRLAPQRYAVFKSMTHVSGLKSVMHAIWSTWLPGSGFEVADAPMLEHYDQSFNPETGMGGFRIWLPLR